MMKFLLGMLLAYLLMYPGLDEARIEGVVKGEIRQAKRQARREREKATQKIDRHAEFQRMKRYAEEMRGRERKLECKSVTDADGKIVRVIGRVV